MDYEIGKIREVTMLTNPSADFNTSYTFFYDETNNFRKLKVREFDFNNSLDANFVLGGVVYSGERPQIDDIFDFLKLPANQTEVKFKTIANGDFLICLTSKNLNQYYSVSLIQIYICIISVSIIFIGHLSIL